MAIDNNSTNFVSKNVIKGWFKTGLKPLQNQFWAWMDSYWHKDEEIPLSKIENFSSIIDGKASINHTHAQYANTDAENLTQQNVFQWRERLNITDGGSTTDDVVSDYDLGGVEVGDVIPAGTNTQSLAEFLFKGEFTPELIAPTLSLSQNASATREIGESVQIVLTANFNRGDIKGANVGNIWNVNASQGARAGVATAYKFMGVANGTTANKTITHTVVANTNTFTTEVTYAASTIQPKNNKGDDFGSPLPAGSLIASTSLVGRYKIFYGNSNGSTAARSLPQSTWANVNSFDLTAAMGFNYYDLYVVATKQLVSVIDVEIGNVDITTAYVDKGLVTVNDAGGTAISYRKYQLYNAAPYSDKNHTHKITLKDL